MKKFVYRYRSGAAPSPLIFKPNLFPGLTAGLPSAGNVARVKVNFVSPKQLKEFLLKVSLPMVLILITDVFNERVLD